MSDAPSEPDLPDWLGKAFGLFALLILLVAVIAVVTVLFPRLFGF